jgi:hypothetical protein
METYENMKLDSISKETDPPLVIINIKHSMLEIK